MHWRQREIIIDIIFFCQKAMGNDAFNFYTQCMQDVVGKPALVNENTSENIAYGANQTLTCTMCEAV